MPEPIYRPGLDDIIAGDTAVSSLAGRLLYRGYPAEELAQRTSYEEVAYLILYGEMPKRDELAKFTARLRSQAPIPAELIDILGRIPREASMMDIMRSGCSLLAAWDPDQRDNSRDANLRKAERLVAQLPVVMAARYRMLQGKEPVAPERDSSHAANLLFMLRGTKPTPDAARSLDFSMIVYAEHEFNASTFTARVVASTLSDLHSAVTAAIGALKGPLHGGANERVLDELKQVGSSDKAEAWIRDMLARKEKIMGFGHRVYKEGDPRAKYLRPLVVHLAKETGHDDVERTAETIERVLLAEKNLMPNVDWPTARLYHYLDLPKELYTPLFVVSRVVGWSAHVIEMLQHGRLLRPMAKYIGAPQRNWIPIEKR